MLTSLLLQTIGPAGRWIIDQYLAHGPVLSAIVAIWMVVVGVGQYRFGKLQHQVRGWLRKELATGASTVSVLASLEPRWQQATETVRWMPAANGWWTQPVADTQLRELVGFTPAQVDRLATALAAARERDARKLAELRQRSGKPPGNGRPGGSSSR